MDALKSVRARGTAKWPELCNDDAATAADDDDDDDDIAAGVVAHGCQVAM
jgi:hypothetical protein